MKNKKKSKPKVKLGAQTRETLQKQGDPGMNLRTKPEDTCQMNWSEARKRKSKKIKAEFDELGEPVTKILETTIPLRFLKISKFKS